MNMRRLPGVGPKAEERLRSAGIETIGDLAALGDEELRRLLPGSVGTVRPSATRVERSHSSVETFSLEVRA